MNTGIGHVQFGYVANPDLERLGLAEGHTMQHVNIP